MLYSVFCYVCCIDDHLANNKEVKKEGKEHSLSCSLPSLDYAQRRILYK